MDSDFDEKKDTLKDTVFDSKDIVRKDNREMFVKIEGAEERAKKAAEAEAKREADAKRAEERAANEERRKANREKNRKERSERSEHLYQKFWAGKKKKKTIWAFVLILLVIFAYPIYLGASTLIGNIIAEIEKREEAALEALPENYVNIVYQNLNTKYSKEGLEAGEKYFKEELAKASDDKMRGDLYMERANALTSAFEEEQLDLALESALKAEELSPSERTVVKIMTIYQQKGDTIKYNKYRKIYNERIGAQDEGGRG